MTVEREKVSAPDPSLLRQLPGVDRLLEHPQMAHSLATFGRGLVTYFVRMVLEERRQAIIDGRVRTGPAALQVEHLIEEIVQRLGRDSPALPRVLNATGVILHSGLGRAPLPARAVEALVRAGGYSLLEVEREDGRRRSRDTRAGDLLRRLTGAEGALVVNNNAAATMLILNTLGRHREVICSRGELVEIGGSFRIPDVMEASGCRLVAVGTTNKTHLSDYEQAIGSNTAALLVVHTSNYRIVGFTSSPTLPEIAGLARQHQLPLIHDLGSGSLLSPQELGLGDEPPVGRSLECGADVVCMSGDKLLGGPQAGIILGRAELVDRMRRNPMARALRIDKMAVAALEATLQLFLEPEQLSASHPVIQMLATPAEDLLPRAESLAQHLRRQAPPEVVVTVVPLSSEAGSGALPTLQIPSQGVAVAGPFRPGALAQALRLGNPALFTRIVDDRVCLDLRTLFSGEEVEAAALLAGILPQIMRP